jgi:hypothetical protein
MQNRVEAPSRMTIRPGMEIITRDGKRAGYVADISPSNLISEMPVRRIPLQLIRRVDEADVYISLRLLDL